MTSLCYRHWWWTWSSSSSLVDSLCDCFFDRSRSIDRSIVLTSVQQQDRITRVSFMKPLHCPQQREFQWGKSSWLVCGITRQVRGGSTRSINAGAEGSRTGQCGPMHPLLENGAKSLLATPFSAVVVKTYLPRALANKKAFSWRHSHALRRHDCIPTHYPQDPWHDLTFREMEWDSCALLPRTVVSCFVDPRRKGEHPNPPSQFKRGCSTNDKSHKNITRVS